MWYILFIFVFFNYAQSAETPKNPTFEQQDTYNKLMAEAPKAPPLERQDSYDRLIEALKLKISKENNDMKTGIAYCQCNNKKPSQSNFSHNK